MALSRTKSHVSGLSDAGSGQIDQKQFYQEGVVNEVKVSARFFTIACLIFECFLMVIAGVWFTYSDPMEAVNDLRLYPYFRDVSIMIFFGFGFLMTFLRRYGFSAIGYTLVFSALTVQWSLILQAFFEAVDGGHGTSFSEKHAIGVQQLLDGLFCAGAVMISFGALLGKVSPFQLLILVIVEPIFFWLNIYVCAFQLEAIDIGGGYYIHMLGAYLGVVATIFLTNKHTHGHPDNTSNYSSDVFSLAGTLFLWILWPSFNAAIAEPGVPQSRAIVNTFLSLTGSTLAAFVVSRVVSGGRFDAVHIQNSTLSGGVAMGIAAHLELQVVTAMCVGFIAGTVSVLGYVFITPKLNRYLRIQDICGVHNLHGLPSIIAAITSIIATATSDPDQYPQGKNQPGYQTAALAVTIGFAIVGGLVAGFLMWVTTRFLRIDPANFFNDRLFWHRPSDYEHVVRGERSGDGVTP
eukprot:CAMPEP_0174233130 /NCGR_PEP_ID=MMETSP0417-20130205/3251_1 /TAXON_ID=242541 /ORGANISM="Mayorella sp, Strain BSH-02190019" /LENGTH=462 /DNA_ID=CAMNT_0015311297 /DNA_START=109 /DNA_END=1494 /DNA_ORIENTATION=-